MIDGRIARVDGADVTVVAIKVGVAAIWHSIGLTGTRRDVAAFLGTRITVDAVAIIGAAVGERSGDALAVDTSIGRAGHFVITLVISRAATRVRECFALELTAGRDFAVSSGALVRIRAASGTGGSRILADADSGDVLAGV